MIFSRESPPRVSKNYHYYKHYLRKDFLNRCSYCLRHEAHFGGEANGQIDHFFPAAEFNKSGEKHLLYTYSNLFWSCTECNNNKGETWPSSDEVERGLRFIDASREDTDQHWQVLPTGEIEPLTPAGRFTIGMILLWRDDLNCWRRMIIEAKNRIERLKNRINDPALTPEDKNEFHEQMKRELLFVYPFPFDRLLISAKQIT